MATLTLTIDPTGRSVTKYPDPFYAGQPGDTVTLVLTNEDLVNPHQVRLEGFKHKGRPSNPFTERPAYIVMADQSISNAVKVRNNADYGRYTYEVWLDSARLDDPEIVIDQMVDRPTAGHGKVKPTKAGKKKGGKEAHTSKKTTARKPARARKVRATRKGSAKKKR